MGAQVANKANLCLKVLWQYGQGMTGMRGRGSLAWAFLACLRCSAEAVLLASHVMDGAFVRNASWPSPEWIAPRCYGLMPNAARDGFRVVLKRFFWHP